MNKFGSITINLPHEEKYSWQNKLFAFGTIVVLLIIWFGLVGCDMKKLQSTEELNQERIQFCKDNNQLPRIEFQGRYAIVRGCIAQLEIK